MSLGPLLRPMRMHHFQTMEQGKFAKLNIAFQPRVDIPVRIPRVLAVIYIAEMFFFNPPSR